MNDAIAPQCVQFIAEDGWQLEGDIYRGNDPKIAVLISTGTGFLRSFYHHIASYLAAQGAVVMIYDYRGIGGSNSSRDAFLNIEYADWGRFDLAAAIEFLRADAPDLPLTHVAHSAGGHFLGVVANHDVITRHAFVSVGTGYFGGHHLKYLPTEFYFWWLLGAFSLTRYGYIKKVGGWQGEALPPKLFKTWRRWSHRSAYFKHDFETALAPQHYDKVTGSIRSWVFTDDPIATPKAAADLLDCYPATPHEVIIRSPADFGLKRVGHEGAFRKGREKLWAEIWDWLATSS